MFSPDLLADATAILATARQSKQMIATAESCTGGLIIGCLTEIAGSSDVVDRGFITYSNDAKMEMLGVPGPMLAHYGAVSEPVALAMAAGAVANSGASVAVAVTGIAGPGGGSADKPVGLVYMAGAARNGYTFAERHDFGDIGRDRVRQETVKAALAILKRLLAR